MKNLLLGIFALLSVLTSDVFAGNPATLNVGTYNIRMNTPVDGVNTWANRKDRVRALIDFHEYDVLGIQEAFIYQIDDLLSQPGYAYVGDGRDGGREGEYSAILYRPDRIRILDSGTFWLSETPDRLSKGWDAQLHRICTWAKMQDRRTKQVFYYFNTHFDHIGRVARRESARLLLEKIVEIAGQKYPVVCTGDFNAEISDEPMQVLLGGLQDARELSLTPPYRPGWSYTGFDVLVPEKLKKSDDIDHVLVNDKVQILKYGVLTDSNGEYYPSDHYPVFVRIRLK